MYGIFTYIWAIFGVNVGKYSIHGSYGCGFVGKPDDLMVMGKLWENYEKILENDGKHIWKIHQASLDDWENDLFPVGRCNWTISPSRCKACSQTR